MITRPYDVSLPKDVLKLVRQARESPRGRERKVRVSDRGGRKIREYPWAEMQFGDYFITELGSTRLAAFRTLVSQVSVRLDCEFIIHKHCLGSHDRPVPGVLVIRTLENLRSWKVKAMQHHGVVIPISDLGRVKLRKAAARRKSYQKAKEMSSKAVEAVVKEIPPPVEAVVKETQLSVKVDKGAATPVVDVESPNYDRRAAILASLARANKGE